MVDLVGQHKIDSFAFVASIASAIIAFVSGFMLQDMRFSLHSFGGSIVLILFMTVPNWPWWNRHPQLFITDLGERQEAGKAKLAQLKKRLPGC
eukprot:ANDGO_07095.mRNA.1 hypothetical protein H257_03410